VISRVILRISAATSAFSLLLNQEKMSGKVAGVLKKVKFENT